MALLVSKTTNGFEIFKKDADGKPVGESLGTFASEPEAIAKCYADDSSYVYVPWDVTTLAGAFEAAEAQEYAKHINRVVSAFKQVVENIVYAKEVTKKGPAIKSASDELVKMLDSVTSKKTADTIPFSVTTTGTWSTTNGTATWIAGKSGPEVFIPEGEGRIATSDDLKSLKFTPNSTDRIGAYAVLWGDATKKDLDGEFFTEKTEELTKIFDAVGKLPLLYQHSADAVLKTHVLGIVDTLKTDSVGLWYEAQLLMSSQYDEYVKKLIESGKLKTSSQTLPIAKASVGETGEITRWPIVEITATPTPAEYRMPPLQVLKSAYEAMDCGDKFECAIKQYTESTDQGAVKARLLLDQARLQLDLVD